MTSVLNVDSIAAKNGTDPVTLTKQSADKSWWTLNGTSTIAARDSFNVSSFDDVGTGIYDANFTNSMSDGNFGFVGTTGVNSNTAYVFHYHSSQAPASGAVRFATEISNNISPQDQSYIHGMINGDLA
jgi:hypothetical protein